MLVEELKELAQLIQEQQADEQKIEVKAAHIDYSGSVRAG